MPTEAAQRRQVKVVAVKFSLRIALQITAQSNQLTQERVGGIIGSITGGENGVEVKILPQMT